LSLAQRARGTTWRAAAVRVVRQSSYYVYDGRRTTTECLINNEQITIKHRVLLYVF